MITPETLTGDQVVKIRKRLKLTRQQLWEQIGFPNSTSVSRMTTIENKDSWKPGDRELVAAKLNELLTAQGIDPTEIFTAAGSDGAAEPAAGPVQTEIELVAEEDLSDDGDDEDDDPLITEIDLSAVVSPFRITQSELKSFKRCPRQWWLRWYLGLQPTGPGDFDGNMAHGTRVHKALAMYYAADTDRPDLQDCLERVIVEEWTEIRQTATERGADDEEIDQLGARFNDACSLDRAIVEGYVEWEAESGIDADLTILSSETVLSAPLPITLETGEVVTVEIMGTLDARLRTADGRRLFVDHKVVDAFGRSLPTLRQDDQLLHYHLLEFLTSDSADDLCTGALYNMLRRVKRTGNAKPPFFQRETVSHNPAEIDSYRRRLTGTTRNILTLRRKLDAGAEHLDVVDRTSTPDCSWGCEFFRVCPLFDDGSPGLSDALANLYRKGDPLARYARGQEVANSD